MRLSDFQPNIIKQTVRAHFNDKVNVRLFGSKVDDITQLLEQLLLAKTIQLN